MHSKNVSKILKTLFQTGDINIPVLHGAFVTTYVKLKSSFSDEKISSEIFSREAIEINVATY